MYLSNRSNEPSRLHFSGKAVQEVKISRHNTQAVQRSGQKKLRDYLRHLLDQKWNTLALYGMIAQI